MRPEMKLPGLAVAMVLVLLAGQPAGAADPRDPNPLPPDPKVSDCPTAGKYGGRFVIGTFSGGPKTFNALIANESSTTDCTNRMFSGLVAYNNETQKVEPDLAKTWERSRDGRTWTFHMRHARFSDGTPITSADVLFAFQVVYDPVIHPASADIEKVDGKPFDLSAPDPYTVVFKLPGTYALFLDAVGGIPIMPRARLEADFKAKKFESAYGTSEKPEDIITSGPWCLKQFSPNEKVVLRRNPYYYVVDKQNRRLPYLDELVWLIAGNQNADLLKFEAGETDAMDNPRPTDFTRLEQGQAQGKYKVYDLGVSLNTNFMWFNLNLKPDMKTPFVDPVKYRWFASTNFRRAVALGIDQRKIGLLAFQGQAIPNWGPATRGNKLWFDANVKQYNYNLPLAKSLLEKEGFKDRNNDGWREDPQGHKLTFTLITNAGNTVREAMCTLIKSDLKKLGIDVIVSPIDFNLMVGKLREQRDYEAALLGLQTGVPPDPALGQNVWKSTGKTHFWNIEQPRPETAWEAETDSLMGALMRVDDYPARKKIWDHIQETVTDQVPLIYLPSQKSFCAVRDKFGNLRPTTLPHRLLWNSDQIYVRK